MRRLWKWLAAVCATVVIGLAMLVGLFRILVPQLPEYHERIEGWAGAALGMPVDITGLDARWGLDGPELLFSDAKLLSSDGSTVLAQAGSGSIAVSVWRLITERELSLQRVTLDNARVSIERAGDGGLRLLGQDRRGAGFSLDSLPDALYEVRDSELSYHDSVTGRGPWRFTDFEANIERDGDMLHASGQLELPAALGETLRFSANLAMPSDGGAVRAELYGETDRVELSGWSNLLPAVVPVAGAGHGPAAGRAVLSGVELEQIQVNADLAGVLPPEAESGAAAYDRLAGVFRWARTADGWEMAARDLELRRGESVWPSADLLLRVARPDPAAAPSVHAEASYLRIEDLLPLAGVVPDNELIARIDAFAPRGVLRDLSLDYAETAAGEPDFELSVNIDDAAVRAVDRLPAVSGVSGKVEASESGGRAMLDAQGVDFTMSPLFRNALHADTAAGAITWRRDDDAWRVAGDSVVLRNADVDMRSSFELDLPRGDGSPVLDLETEIVSGDLANFEQYLPAGKLPPKVLEWLDRAVAGGRVQSGRLTFAGPTHAFPFEGDEGVFRAAFTVEDALLDYASGWPAIEGLKADVVFEQVSMRAQADAGKLLGNRIVQAEAGFADLRDGRLLLEGRTQGSLGDVHNYLMESPLKGHLGPFADRIEVGGGQGQVDLDLELPIKSLADRRVGAMLTLEDGVIGLQGIEPRFEGIVGALRLADGYVSGDGIEASLFGRPVQLEVLPGGASTPNVRAVAVVSGRMSAPQLGEHLDFPLVNRIEGDTPWLATARFPAADAVDPPPFSVRIESNLKGMGVELPAPFGKAPETTVPFAMGFRFPESGRLNINGNWGSGNGSQPTDGGSDAFVRLRAELVKSAQGWGLEKGAARFGGGQPELPETGGFVLQGRLPELRLDDWLALRREQGEAASDGFADAFRSARLMMDDLYAFDQHVPGPVQLSLDRSAREWLIEIDSGTVAGAIFLPFDLQASPLLLRMDRLQLAAKDPQAPSDASQRDPRSLPAMDIRIDDFALGERQLGAVEAKLARVPDGLSMTSLATKAEAFQATGTGAWVVTSGGQQTRVSLEVESGDVGATLSALGYGEIVDADSGAATFDLRWPDAPTGEILAGLSGEASVRLDDGQVNDIEPGAGRVFGLLSVAALPRRLGLDFRDVFTEGLAFDKVAGDFSIEDGQAYTSNLLLEGPAADIGIVGRAGLAARDYDQTAVVSTNVGTTLPIAAFLAGGPQVAAAMLLFSQIFKKPIKGMTQVYYHVGGSWEDPQVERIAPVQKADEPAGDAARDRTARPAELPDQRKDSGT